MLCDISTISIAMLFHVRSRSLCRQEMSLLIGCVTTQIQQFANWRRVGQLFVNCSPSLVTVQKSLRKLTSPSLLLISKVTNGTEKKLWREKQPEIRLASTSCFLLYLNAWNGPWNWKSVHLQATSLQRLFFLTDSPCLHSCFNLSTMATFFRPVYRKTELYVTKVAVVERFNCIMLTFHN